MAPTEERESSERVRHRGLKKRRRSKEATERHRQRYLEILRRRRENEGVSSGRQDLRASSSSFSGKRTPALCKYYYRTGSCVHGSSCDFSHDCIPLNTKELKLCRFYLQEGSSCRYSASECKYSHDPGLFLCRPNVVFGKCGKGAHCMFKHADDDAISSMDDAEKLRFCYNNKRFLIDLLASKVRETSDSIASGPLPDEILMPKLLSLEDSYVARLPWYLRVMHILLVRDHETSDSS